MFDDKDFKYSYVCAMIEEQDKKNKNLDYFYDVETNSFEEFHKATQFYDVELAQIIAESINNIKVRVVEFRVEFHIRKSL